MMRLLCSVLLVGSAGMTGCAANVAAPAVPERVAPDTTIAPAEPPPPTHGRVFIDAVGAQAKVSDVTETTTVATVLPQGGRGNSLQALQQRKLRPLCITPCAVDLTQGWHSLVFESVNDELATSTVDVTVSSRPLAVRHALGRDKPPSGGYLGGVMMVIPASGLLLSGTLMAIIGATASDPGPGLDANGHAKSDARVLLPIGLVLTGIGVALGLGGTLLILNNRPEKQPGSTTQWALP
jgi:hypothetical protein